MRIFVRQSSTEFRGVILSRREKKRHEGGENGVFYQYVSDQWCENLSQVLVDRRPVSGSVWIVSTESLDALISSPLWTFATDCSDKTFRTPHSRHGRTSCWAFGTVNISHIWGSLDIEPEPWCAIITKCYSPSCVFSPWRRPNVLSRLLTG